MNRLFILLTLIGLLQIHYTDKVYAQDSTNEYGIQSIDDSADVVQSEFDNSKLNIPVYQKAKAKFIEGGVVFMGFVLLCFIFGLAIAIERIIYLNLSTTNTKKLLTNIEESLYREGTEAAKEVCRNTRGPVASIFYEGLSRSEEGLEMVEKSIISYGSVQMGLLEKNLSWISLFIALSPMLGFLGTVQGMIMAFDNIRLAGNVSPQIVAQGIGVALLTTLFGLLVAIVLQVFYNYIISKIDSIVNRMEDASISLMDILIKYHAKRN